MGLFDNITVECDFPEGEGMRTFQTKDLECYSLDYRITSERRLIRKRRWYVDKNDPETDADLNFHGILNFYAYDAAGQWREFNAKFTDGTLVSIVPVEDRP